VKACAHRNHYEVNVGLGEKLAVAGIIVLDPKRGREPFSRPF
jgi:hypothetical protein